jgi:transposase
LRALIEDLYEDWERLDARIDAITQEIEEASKRERSCQKLMTIPGIGPLISTAMVAAIGSGEAFERGRDFGAWSGLIPKQHSTAAVPSSGV